MPSSWNDDDQLLAALKDAVRPADAVPRDFVEAGKASFAWHNIDAELAALTYDSALQEDRASVVTRAEPASARFMTYSTKSQAITIELEITNEALLGQIVPGGSGGVEAHTAGGLVATVPIDEIGCFIIRPIPLGSFRLHCHISGRADVLTGWISL